MSDIYRCEKCGELCDKTELVKNGWKQTSPKGETVKLLCPKCQEKKE